VGIVRAEFLIEVNNTYESKGILTELKRGVPNNQNIQSLLEQD